MVSLSIKKVIICTLLTYTLIVPGAIAAGTNFDTAEEVTEGVYSFQWVMPVNEPNRYYNISCSAGDILYVAIVYDHGLEMSLFLYNPSKAQVCINESPTMAGLPPLTYLTCKTSCTTAGTYYIRVYTNHTPATASALTYVLSVILIPSSQGIPGFESLFVFYSFVILLGLVGLLRIRKKL